MGDVAMQDLRPRIKLQKVRKLRSESDAEQSGGEGSSLGHFCNILSSFVLTLRARPPML